MARLPVPASDEGQWGGILNEFLSQSHKVDGNLKNGSVGAAQLQDSVVTSSKLAPNSVTGTNVADNALPQAKVQGLSTDLSAKYVLPTGGVPEADLSPGVQTKLNAAATGTATPDATTTTKGVIRLAGDLSGTALAPTVPGLGAKANDTTVVHLAGAETISGVKSFTASPTVPTPTNPIQVTNKSYVDNAILTAASTVPGATTTTKGTIQLAGDLGGTATVPTVPGLAAKADNSAVVHLLNTETIGGVKTFSSAPLVPDSSFAQTKVTNLTTDLAAKATDAAVVHLAGAETISGVKTFSAVPDVPDGSFTQAKVQGLATSLSAKYSLPAGGIPEADLTSAVQTKLNAPGVTNLDDLADVTTASATDGQSLIYNLGSWGPATVGTGGGVSDHGALTGLGDDDHPQYHTDARGDARYYTHAQSDTLLAAKADSSGVVHTTTDETINGVKTFVASPVVPTPSSGTDAANKAYIDTAVSSAVVADATSSSKGIIQLAGDLAGTATVPTVPGLAAKATDTLVVHLAGAETISGVKTFSASPAVPDGSFAESKVINLTTDLAAKAVDSTVVHLAGAETVTGVKTFSTAPLVPDGSFAEVKVTNLVADLAAKATDTSVVHVSGDEAVAGIKAFSASPTVPTPTLSTQAANKSYVDSKSTNSAGPVTLTHTAGTPIAIDASLSNSFRVTLVGNPQLASPTNPTDGQMIMLEMAAGSAARTVTFTSGSAGSYEYTKAVPLTPAPILAANKTGFIGVRYSVSTARWHLLAFEPGA